MAARQRLWLLLAAALLALVVAAGMGLRPAPEPSPAAAGERVMLAVLPFANFSADPDQEYFSDGLTEEMIAHLGRVDPSRLGVIARTSVAVFRKGEASLEEIGRRLGVEYVLEGSVRRQSDRVRITAQLVRVSDRTHLWAEIYDRPLEDVFAIQQEVAGRVSRSLLGELLPDVAPGLAAADPQAYDHYLRGRYHFTRYDREGYRRAMASYRRAVERDPGFALAWAALAEATAFLSWDGEAPADVFPQARRAAEEALRLDPAVPQAHNALGIAQLYYEWDFAGAEASFRRALELDAGYAEAYHWVAGLYSAQGRHEEAIEHDLVARRLDPVSLTVRSDLCWYRLFAGDWDGAAAECRATLKLEPYHRWALHGLVEAETRRGDLAAAWAAQERLLAAREEPVPAETPAPAAALAAVAARRLAELRARGEGADQVDLAMALAAAGDLAAAFAALDRAVAERHPWAIFLGVDPRYEPLRADPRFDEVRRRVGLPGTG